MVREGCSPSAEAAKEAIENLQPCELRSGRGACYINANRRAATASGERFLGINPMAHAIAKSSSFESIRSLAKTVPLSQEPIAVLANYACHPTIMGPPNRLITPDYPGATKRSSRTSSRRQMHFPARLRR